MSFPFHVLQRARLGIVCAVALGAALAHAQTPATERPTLAQALEAAWSLSSAARSLANRQAELDARQRAAGSFIASSPSLTLAHRTDQPGTNRGLREYEVEFALPLKNPGVRSASQAQVGAERAAFDSAQFLARLKLAGELRELSASAALAELERDLAARKLTEARTLAQDVARRVQGGDSPRIDSLQAEATARQAAVQQAQAESALAQVHGQWRALTGLTLTALASELPGTASAEHPALAAAQTQERAAQARLALADADRRDPLELGLGTTRERDVFGASAQNALRLALRIPFGGDGRNAVRQAAARAELDAAQAERDTAQRQVQTGMATAQAALDAARRAQTLAAERAALSGEAQALVAKSYQLGESDWPTRLLTDNTRFDAELALTRAQVETQRAISRLNQALGLLP